MELIKGKKIAEDILAEIKERIKKQGTNLCLAVILIGNNEASQIYVKLKKEAAKKIGMGFKEILFSENVAENEVMEKIEELNADEKVNGVIVQLPLPEKLNKEKIINTIALQKDVDGFHRKNQNNFLENKKGVFPVFPKAIIRMIESVLKSIAVKPQKAVIVCRSVDFGRIMKKVFERMGLRSEFVFCDDLEENSKNKYAQIILKRADIIVTACGILNLINRKMTKNNAIIIDGGIIKKDGKIFGDVNAKSLAKSDCLISSVPGGVGPVTVATLLENVYLAHEKKEK